MNRAPVPSLAWQLLHDGVPPSLLIDLLDPDGMRAALAAELLPADVAATAASGAEQTPLVRTA